MSKPSSVNHSWQKIDIELTAVEAYENPYVDVTVWVDLSGPGFRKRIYGFWNGGQSFVVHLLATAAGQWHWTSGSNQGDAGLNGQSGSFEVIPWKEAELAANPNRRGMVQATGDGRGLEYADGTPFFLLGDTWWSTPTWRFPLRGDGIERPLGPEAGLEDYVRLRKAQGFNSVGILAALPNWASDGYNRRLMTDDGIWLRQAWGKPGTETAMDMHNEGGRPFLFPGKVPGYEDAFPDMDRINPDYFKVLDEKIDYLNAQGFVPFLEVSRRDMGQAWQKYYDWPDSYTRYVQYVFARYQANIIVLSPIHYDSSDGTIPGREYNEPINAVIDGYGPSPFGAMLSANSSPSTLVNFGGPDECRWIDMHQIGNLREHHAYWYLTEIFNSEPASPALNGEPYYADLFFNGGGYDLHAEPDSDADLRNVRSGMYGSFLSGGYAGYIYGCEGIWQANVEPGARTLMWDAFLYESAKQVQHLKAFAMVKGTGYRTLIPDSELLVPNKSDTWHGYTGWCYCAYTPERDWFMVYFEQGCDEEVRLRGGLLGRRYQASWFDPRSGVWGEPQEIGTVSLDSFISLPARPDEQDWGLMVELLAE